MLFALCPSSVTDSPTDEEERWSDDFVSICSWDLGVWGEGCQPPGETSQTSQGERHRRTEKQVAMTSLVADLIKKTSAELAMSQNEKQEASRSDTGQGYIRMNCQSSPCGSAVHTCWELSLAD